MTLQLGSLYQPPLLLVPTQVLRRALHPWAQLMATLIVAGANLAVLFRVSVYVRLMAALLAAGAGLGSGAGLFAADRIGEYQNACTFLLRAAIPLLPDPRPNTSLLLLRSQAVLRLGRDRAQLD